jgi:hypothetical protein
MIDEKEEEIKERRYFPGLRWEALWCCCALAESLLACASRE